MKLIAMAMPLVNLLMVAINIPGMLHGYWWSIAAGIFCAVCVGITLILAVLMGE